MEHILTDISETVVPKYGVVFYDIEGNHYAESCKVVDNKMTAFQPLSQKALRGFMNLVKIDEDYQFQMPCKIPKNVIQYNASQIIWSAKGDTRTYHLGKKKYDLTMPNFVFKYTNTKQLYVLCYKDKYLNEKTKLYSCPLPNLSGDGNMCWGNNPDTESTVIPKIIAYVTSMFFDSQFTHYNDGSPSDRNWFERETTFNNKNLKYKCTLKKFI